MTNEDYMPRQGFLLVTIESESEWLTNNEMSSYQTHVRMFLLWLLLSDCNPLTGNLVKYKVAIVNFISAPMTALLVVSAENFVWHDTDI